MAVSGSVTSAYRVCVCDGETTLRSVPTTTFGTLCTKPSVAVGMIAEGRTVTVTGSDMAELRRLWAERQVSEVQA